jgi:hypothetical protein
MSEAHKDELEALQAFLIKEHELTVLTAAPESLKRAAAAVNVSLTGATILKFRITPSDAKEEEEGVTPDFYLWLHVAWGSAYPATEFPVVDLDDEHNCDYLSSSARRAMVTAMLDEVS